MLLCTLLTYQNSYGFELHDGISRLSPEFGDEYSIKLMRAGAVGMDAYLLDYLNTNETVVLIDNKLYRFDKALNVIGNWPLTRWAKKLHSSLYGHQYGNIGLYEESDLPKLRIGAGPSCYGNTPLRYGDIEGDGNNELVLWLNGDFVIFSPQYERTVFEANLKFHDYLSDSEMDDPQYTAEGLPQNISLLATLNYYVEWIPGARVYAKIFAGDFDQDQNPDILIWQKEFESNLNTNSQKGFHLYGQKWVHYERDLEAQAKSESGVTGEYLPQETPEDDIKTWLLENDLTWRKGYPSLSECAGEEGKLIPEMHDPLLNDPDVLQ
ncbi:MAG: hypothetical protein P8X74_20025 [Reinekea sp.]